MVKMQVRLKCCHEYSVGWFETCRCCFVTAIYAVTTLKYGLYCGGSPLSAQLQKWQCGSRPCGSKSCGSTSCGSTRVVRLQSMSVVRVLLKPRFVFLGELKGDSDPRSKRGLDPLGLRYLWLVWKGSCCNSIASTSNSSSKMDPQTHTFRQ